MPHAAALQIGEGAQMGGLESEDRLFFRNTMTHG